ncbi:sodium channel protein Nach-like [Cydia splendana]|uniref:sodium channel protein Nach-like n=1 Tax=Cydia splendana TaxID=1100963 RepID=UPI00213E95FB
MEKKQHSFFHEELAPCHMPKQIKKLLSKRVRFQEAKTRVKLSREQIVRKSLQQVFFEYMVNSSLSGVRFLVDTTKSKAEKTMWFAMIGCAIFGFFYLVNNALRAQSDQPAYMTLEDPSLPINEIIFPAIAICNHNRIKKSAVAHLVDVLYSHDNTTFSSKEELFEVVTLYGYLYDFSYSRRADIMKYNVFLEKIENIVDKAENIKKSNISELMLSLTPTCDESLIKCSWKGVVQDCNRLFRTQITQFGFCCTFNYYNTEAGRKAEDPDDPLDEPYILKDHEAGPYYGLTLAVNANTHEYLYTTRQSYGFDVLFFDRYDYADQTAGGLVHRVASLGSQYDMELHPYAYYSTSNFKRFPIEKRQCKFADEMQNEYHNHYSLSNCLVRCRMRTIERLCNCVPFFLPRRSNVSACTLEELYCQNKYSQKLLFVYPPEDLPGLELERENSLNCPTCLADCSVTKYNVISNRLLRDSTIEFAKDLDLNDHNISIIRIFYLHRTLPLFREDVTYHWYELISYLGGLCGFFTGFSMISLAEFFYYIFIRLYYILVENFRRYG